MTVVKKPTKRRKKPKKLLQDKDDVERKKTLATIVHKKKTVSSNWQSFLSKNMHLEKSAAPVEQEVKDKSYYKGQFRKNRKLGPTVPVPKVDEPVEDEEASSSALPRLTANATDSYKNAKLTRHIGIDCEMVGVDDGKDNMLARVSLVNKFGECVYDKFVLPKEDVVDYRTHVSGVRPIDLVNAESFETVQKEVYEIIEGRILVGHALRNDLNVLYLSHPRKNIRDTSKYKKFRQLYNGRTPSLKKLTASILGVTIQDGEHNSIIDARATMQLYMMYSKEWEAERRAGNKKRNLPAPSTSK